jgi:hypothetical protein
LSDNPLAVEDDNLALGKYLMLAGIMFDAHEFLRAERGVTGSLERFQGGEILRRNRGNG